MKRERHFDFRDLKVWQRCRVIRKEIWLLCKTLPREEQYRLSDQMIRASRSATACIAEGYGRFHFQETIQFGRQARGSLYELIDHIDTATECEFLSPEGAARFIENIKTTIWILNGYIKYLKSRKMAARVQPTDTECPPNQPIDKSTN